MNQIINIFIGWQAYVVCFVIENTDVVVLYTYLAFRQIDASIASAATAKVTDRAHNDFGANYVARYCVLIPSVNKYAIVFDQTSLMREHGGDAAYFARQGFYSI